MQKSPHYICRSNVVWSLLNKSYPDDCMSNRLYQNMILFPGCTKVVKINVSLFKLKNIYMLSIYKIKLLESPKNLVGLNSILPS